MDAKKAIIEELSTELFGGRTFIDVDEGGNDIMSLMVDSHDMSDDEFLDVAAALEARHVKI